MFGRSLTLFKVLGFPIRVDLSWFLILLVITWSLAASFFPLNWPGLGSQTYWIMGTLGALALFACVVLHELGHAVAARRYDIRMKGITLFVFGGVAEMADEPRSPRAEFVMAIGGPLVSIALVGIFWLLLQLSWPTPVRGVLSYLAWINAILVLFNMAPAFPLDGGRVLRSILWRVKQDLTWATRVTSAIGSGFGVALIVLGAINLFYGALVPAIWWFLLGMFLRGAARMSYQQLIIRKALENEPVSRFMHRDPITVTDDLTIDQLIEEYLYPHHVKLFPVIEGDNRLVGCVDLAAIKQVPPAQRALATVRDIMQPCTQQVIAPEADAMQALMRMNEQQLTHLLVTQDDQLLGVVSAEDLSAFLNLKLELGDADTRHQPPTWGHPRPT